jgi:hypothetical protein
LHRVDRSPRRLRRIVVGMVVIAAVLAAPAGSLASALLAPGNDALTTRSVEWVRDHHGVAAVDATERWWYSHHPPPVGGSPPAALLPATGPISTATAAPAPPLNGDPPDGADVTIPEAAPPLAPAAAPASGPPPVESPASPALSGEGQWTPVAGPDGRAVGYRTVVRPDALHTSELVGVLRLDQHRVGLRLFPGLKVPGDTAIPLPSAVPAEDDPSLVAAFNGGFRMQDARGGFFDAGVTAAPLVPGAASIAVRRDGTATIGAWGRDLAMADDVVAVRQNLSLLVDGGRPAPDLATADQRRWGSTLGNAVLVWRSGIGETADGDLVYVAGPALSASSLADILVRAGALRAMELDINSDWTTCNLYHRDAAGQVVAEKLLPTMKRPAQRYLTPDSRDFFAVLAR